MSSETPERRPAPTPEPGVDIKPRSRDVTDGLEKTAARGMLRAVGMGDEDWPKPQVGVASSWNEITPCNLSLDRLAKAVKNGVHAGGGQHGQVGACGGGHREVEDHVDAGGHDRLDDLRVGVAEDPWAVGLDVVDVAAAIGVEDVRALGTVDEVGGAADRPEGTHRRVDAAGDDPHRPLEERLVSTHAGLTRRGPRQRCGRGR